MAQDRVYDFYKILRKTKHPIRRLNEEMGIRFITTQKGPDGRQQQERIIDRTPAIKIMAVILIIEICGAIKNNSGDIMVDITEIIGMV